MAAFPTLTSTFGFKPSSKEFTETMEDVSMKSNIEGGYVATRPKHTRTPRRKWKIVYKQLDNADKLLLDNHWIAQKGGSLIFDWINPQNGVTYSVRYVSDKLEWSYKGANTYQRWDCSFELEQA